MGSRDPAARRKRLRYDCGSGDCGTGEDQAHISLFAGDDSDLSGLGNFSSPRSGDGPAHDARLVAAMEVHGITAILTFDKSGFSRYPGIEVVHPEQVKG